VPACTASYGWLARKLTHPPIHQLQLHLLLSTIVPPTDTTLPSHHAWGATTPHPHRRAPPLPTTILPPHVPYGPSIPHCFAWV